MKLRNFKKEDAPIIAGWIQSEEELYKWSADSFNKFLKLPTPKRCDEH